ncbi:MAG: hypothetical protein A2749_00205 [Parcubacteria group bacterium RIFCSPHIGHO2_01_FULL_45_26]|nr:MAG: hypothetical protein A2749_00205 [Parcubacteria group bacterium RIFCSPHIGHO2_01_FULL_45_26]
MTAMAVAFSKVMTPEQIQAARTAAHVEWGRIMGEMKVAVEREREKFAKQRATVTRDMTETEAEAYIREFGGYVERTIIDRDGNEHLVASCVLWSRFPDPVKSFVDNSFANPGGVVAVLTRESVDGHVAHRVHVGTSVPPAHIAMQLRLAEARERGIQIPTERRNQATLGVEGRTELVPQWHLDGKLLTSAAKKERESVLTAGQVLKAVVHAIVCHQQASGRSTHANRPKAPSIPVQKLGKVSNSDGTLNLIWTVGVNTKTGQSQWQALLADEVGKVTRCVVDRDSANPTKAGEVWKSRCTSEIAAGIVAYTLISPVSA